MIVCVLDPAKILPLVRGLSAKFAQHG